ncbi:MAG: MATE family efflux transporter [Clostridia bacterium]|nr:MATE family efflux transporter [Clostridia bacterium]
MERNFDRSSYTLVLWRLMLPIVLQNLLSAVVSTADVLMLTHVSQAALSASSLAGQVTFVLTLFYFGLSTGASVLAAQYWGKGDAETIRRVQGIALRYSCAVSFLFFLAAVLIPCSLMRIFTQDEQLITYGAGYLRFVSVSYLMMGISQMLLAVMKSMEQTKVSAQISTVCLLSNIFLNAVSIYVLFPNDPYEALCGVALATSLARIIEVKLCHVALKKGNGIKTAFRDVVHTDSQLRRHFVKCTLPVQANYLIWGCATAAIAAILGHISADAVAASSLAGTLRNLVIVACGGFGTAGSILVGKLLGQSDFDGARWVGKRIFSGSLLLGAGSGLLLLLLYLPCRMLVHLEENAAALFQGMLLINAIYCIGKSFNSSLVGGIFCAGGDTRFGLVCDAVSMWCVILPLGYLSAFVWHWPALAVYTVLCMDEFVKLPFVALRFRQYKWLKNLTGSADVKNTNTQSP